MRQEGALRLRSGLGLRRACRVLSTARARSRDRSCRCSRGSLQDRGTRTPVLMVVDPQTELNFLHDPYTGWDGHNSHHPSRRTMHRKPHCKALLRTMGNVMSRRVKSQWANPIHEPRKLRSSVFSIWKHGSNGMPRSDAQTASPLALSVPAGSDTVRSGPAPRNWMVPMTEPSP